MTLITALLALGVGVVAPLAWRLLPHPVNRWRLAPAAGALGATGLLVRGRPGAVLALAWLVVAATGAVRLGLDWLRSPAVTTLPPVVATGYLVVGAGFLVAHLADLSPAGVEAPFVELTAVHFHYASFAAVLLTDRLRQARSNRVTTTATWLLVVAPPMVATGFVAVPLLQVVGAVVLTAGLWLAAGSVLRRPPTEDPLAALLLRVGAVAVIAPMVLAVQWAMGSAFGTPALSIPAMARTHGMLQSLGYALPTVWAWRRIAAADRADPTSMSSADHPPAPAVVGEPTRPT